jgi:hypothetical protein
MSSTLQVNGVDNLGDSNSGKNAENEHGDGVDVVEQVVVKEEETRADTQQQQDEHERLVAQQQEHERVVAQQREYERLLLQQEQAANGNEVKTEALYSRGVCCSFAFSSASFFIL